MAKKQKQAGAFEMKKARLKAAESVFGLAGYPRRIDLKPGHDELVRVEIPLDRKLCHKREVNPATIRIFRWDESDERFHLVEDSRIDERWNNAVGRVAQPGVYIAAGQSSNPWVQNAVATLRTFGDLLHHPDLGPVIRENICPVILCRGMLGNVLEHIGSPGEHGLPVPPSRDYCDICLGGGAGHAVDTYPRAPAPACTPCNLADYLRCHPDVTRRIVWRDSAAHPYTTWTDDEQAELAAAFDTIRTGGEVGLPETAPAMPHPDHPDTVHAYMSAGDAWQAYIAHLAHTLVVDSCGWVDWSIASYSGDELSLLLDSDSMFHVTVDGNYYIASRPHGHASQGDPTRVYQWLRSEGLVAADHRTTVGRVLEWCRDNLTHFLGGLTPDNMHDHWQYRGWPPVERMISGASGPALGVRHWTAGCWGTAGFLRLVLRTINLPSTMVTNCGHAQPHFPTIGAYLSHGDDPYNRTTRDHGIAGTDLLIDQVTFDEWFAPGAPERCMNIGRQPYELTGEERE